MTPLTRPHRDQLTSHGASPWRTGRGTPPSPLADTVAVISSQALRQNLRCIRNTLTSGAGICPAVKADAYGHGLPQVLSILREESVEGLAVATLEEAMRLRELGWFRPVLVLGPMLLNAPSAQQLWRACEAVAAGINSTITSLQEADLLSRAARRTGKPARVELQVDTGMGRSGLRIEEVDQLYQRLAEDPLLRFEGIFSHFSTADEADLEFAQQQLDAFAEVVSALRRHRMRLGNIHMANSAGLFRLPDSHFDLVRPGLALYGYWAGPAENRPAGLTPTMKVVSRVNEVRQLPENTTIGYGCTYRTTRPSIVGTIPVGYADGFRRLFSNDAHVTLTETRERPCHDVPVIGRVSMDQINIDLTDVGDVRVGDEVVIISDDPAAGNSVESLARKLDTIPYEITTLIGSRIHRVLQ